LWATHEFARLAEAKAQNIRLAYSLRLKRGASTFRKALSDEI